MSLLCHNLSYSPGGRAILSELSLELKRGEFLVLLGHNGSGKSSLIRLINGLAQPQAGDIALAGRSLLGLSIEQRARRIATLSQEPDRATFAELTVEENCRLNRLRGGPLVKREELPPTLAARYRQRVGQLSGGERQLLALSLALKANPELLLLDEHTSALDPKIAAQVMEQTAASVKGSEVTAVMATHDLEQAIRYGDRLVVLREGRICLDLRGEEKQRLSRTELLTYY